MRPWATTAPYVLAVCITLGIAGGDAPASAVTRTHRRVRWVVVLLTAAILGALIVITRSNSASAFTLSAALQPDAGPPLAVGESGTLRVSITAPSCCVTNLILHFTGLSGWTRLGFPAAHDLNLGRNYCDSDTPAMYGKPPRGQRGVWVDFGSNNRGDCDLLLYLTLTGGGTHAVSITAYSGIWIEGEVRPWRRLPGGGTKWSGDIRP